MCKINIFKLTIYQNKNILSFLSLSVNTAGFAYAYEGSRSQREKRTRTDVVHLYSFVRKTQWCMMCY